MKLYEFEGHRILSKVGIDSPFFVTCESLDEVKQAQKRLKFPIVVKVQVLSGKRGQGGGVKICKSQKELLSFCKDNFGKEFNGEIVRFINLTDKVDIEAELYVSITYDTVAKIPFLLFFQQGGVDIEEVKARDPDKIIRVDIDPIDGLSKKDLKKIIKETKYSSSVSEKSNSNSSHSFTLSSSKGSNDNERLVDFLLRLWDAFARYDCRLVEVNPIAKVVGPHPRGVQSLSSAHPGGGHSYMALDAKVILDDNGLARHTDLDVLPKGAANAIPTNREIEARQIDAEDYRGSAGSTFIEFAGSSGGEASDIAVLASGGGASLMIMDSVVANGGKPANYTEYSGNPPAEKVEKLTEITLSREGLSGCLVAGAVANFTDIYETLSGFAKGLKKVKPKVQYPIVVRRGGPRQKEAYEMLEKLAQDEGFDIHLFGPETPVSVACKKMVELSDKFKKLNTSDKN